MRISPITSTIPFLKNNVKSESTKEDKGEGLPVKVIIKSKRTEEPSTGTIVKSKFIFEQEELIPESQEHKFKE